ncbi:MAG: hypothetical protein QXZ44_00155 [Ferroplasma sp.]
MIIKTNSKDAQKAFIENIKNFFDSPMQILPKCTDSCFMCPIKSYGKKIEKMKSTGDFSKYYNSADQFLSGISETYKILENEKAPVMGMIKTNYGSVNYCKRGKTDETVMSGIQNYDNETYRMLSYTNVVKSKKLKIFSTRNYFTATCKNTLGMDFIKDLFNEENIPFEEKDGELSVGKNGNSITIEFYGLKIRVMEDVNDNIVFIMLRHMFLPALPFNLSSDFLEFIPDNKSILDEYITQKVSSRHILARLKKDKINYAIKNGYYIINYKNYTIDEFLDELQFDGKLKPFIKEKLSGMGFVLDAPSQRKVLEYLFPKYKNEIIKIMYGLDDRDIKSLRGNPLEIMENARLLFSKKSMKSKIIEPWSDNSRFLIELITYHFNNGRDDAISYGRKSMKNDIQKSIYYAYLKIQDHSEDWMFTENQIMLGDRIIPYLNKIIDFEDINNQLNDLRGIIQ